MTPLPYVLLVPRFVRKLVRKTLASMQTLEYAAAGGVIIHEGQMLLLDRPTRDEVRLPKGHVDPGEKDDETAVRESIEETGYADLEIVSDLGVRLVEFDSEGRHYRRTEHYYLMRKTSDRRIKRPPKDEEQFRPLWVAMAEAVKMLTFMDEREVALRAINAYQKINP
jgi:8-oxo-dGTP pyrophosphatase MutT (NUDIX family)